jgi:hypothetical protein
MCNLISKYVLFAMLITVTQPSIGQLYEVPLDQRIDQSEVIVEGKVISSEAFRGTDDNIYTSHRVAVSKVLSANQVPATIEVITFGGELDDQLQTWTHLLTLHEGEKGVFFLNAAKPKDAYFRSSVTAYDVYASSQGFVQYRTNETEALIAVEPFKQYDDIEQEVFARIEQKKGHKATFPESASVAMFRTGIRFHFKNIAFDGLNVKFDLYENSLLGNKILNSAGIQLSYNPVFFGPSVANSGGLTIFEKGISLDYGYDFSAADVSSSTAKISLVPNPALGGKVEIGANEQLLGHGEFIIKNPLVDPGIAYNIEQSKAFNTYFEDGVNKQFDTVVVVGSWRNEPCLPYIESFNPTNVRGGTDDIITISGYCFGSFVEGSSKVEFTSAEDGDLVINWMEPIPGDYIEWTDELIRVKVPSIHKKAFDSYDPMRYAGTGKIRVTKAGGLVGGPSNDKLFIRFSAFNQFTISTETPPSESLNAIPTDANLEGGHTVTIESNFKNDALAMDRFTDALDEWRCKTKINYSFTSAAPNYPSSTVPPIIKVQYGSTSAGNQAVTLQDYSKCREGSTIIRFILFSATMTFNNSVIEWYKSNDPSGIVSPQYDLQSIATHELGHLHQLNHINQKNEVMWPFFAKAEIRRDLASGEFEGGTYIVDISQQVFPASNFCKMPLIPHICSTETHDPNIVNWAIFPNPSDGLFTLEGFVTDIVIFNSMGQVIQNTSQSVNYNEHSISLTNQPSGLYYIHIIDNNNLTHHLKVVKL